MFSKRAEGPWHEHSAMCFCGVDRFFRPGYEANLVGNWLPALTGVEEKLKAAQKLPILVADTVHPVILMAESYLNSQIIGYDFQEQSIEEANRKISNNSLSNNQFKVSRPRSSRKAISS